jgi:hypothetical protein
MAHWLSRKWKGLFLVSVGNHTDNITIEATGEELRDVSEDDQVIL